MYTFAICFMIAVLVLAIAFVEYENRLIEREYDEEYEEYEKY